MYICHCNASPVLSPVSNVSIIKVRAPVHRRHPFGNRSSSLSAPYKETMTQIEDLQSETALVLKQSTR
jgi:hypothetical protein